MDYTIDAKNQKLGRLASQVAQILQGKHHADYEPRVAGKDRVIIESVSQIAITGRKTEQKIYYRHTGYMGHLRQFKYKELFAKFPERVLYLAVKRMLPQNYLLQDRLNRLIIKK